VGWRRLGTARADDRLPNFIFTPIPPPVKRRPLWSSHIVAQFDEMLSQATGGPLVMGVALHPYIVGQPFRLRHLRSALVHVARHRGKVCLTHTGAIAVHAAGLKPGIIP
jgi:hypothetical protein